MQNQPKILNSRKRCKWQDCGQMLESELEVYYHVLDKHSCSGKSKCKWQSFPTMPLCNTALQHINMLRDHAVSHFSQIVRPFSCDLCAESFRSSRCVRTHIKDIHGSISYIKTQANQAASGVTFGSKTSLDVVFCDVGSSYQKYEMMLKNINATDYTPSESFLNLIERLKIEGGRIHPGAIYDSGCLQLEARYLENADESIYHLRNVRLKIFMYHSVDHLFRSIDCNPQPSTDQIPILFTPHYRRLCISILKAFYSLLQQYNNEYISALVESELVLDNRFVTRIGLKIVFHPKLHSTALPIRKQLLATGFRVLEDVCVERYKVFENDRIFFATNYVPEENAVILWVTVGAYSVLKGLSVTARAEPFKLIGFTM